MTMRRWGKTGAHAWARSYGSVWPAYTESNGEHLHV